MIESLRNGTLCYSIKVPKSKELLSKKIEDVIKLIETQIRTVKKGRRESTLFVWTSIYGLYFDPINAVFKWAAWLNLPATTYDSVEPYLKGSTYINGSSIYVAYNKYGRPEGRYNIKVKNNIQKAYFNIAYPVIKPKQLLDNDWILIKSYSPNTLLKLDKCDLTNLLNIFFRTCALYK